MLTLPFSECASHEEACILAVSAWNNCLIFPSPPVTFPRHASDHPASLSQKYPKPFTYREVDSRLVLLSPHWDAAWINPFSATDLRLSAFGVQDAWQMSLVLEHRKSSQGDLDLQVLSSHPPQTAWLFSLLPVHLKNLTNASRWTTEYPLHLSYLRRPWPQARSYLPRQSWTPIFVSLAVWDCWKLWWIFCLLVGTRLLHPWDFPGKNTGVGCHFILQETFLPQGSNPGLLHCRWILYQLSNQGSPENIGFILIISLLLGSWLLKSWMFWSLLMSYKKMCTLCFYMDFLGLFNRRLDQLWNTPL